MSEGLSFRLLGFPIRVQPSAFLILGLVLLMHIRGGPEAAVWGGIYGGVILMSVLVHELGHALAGRRMGMGPLDVTIHGLGGYTRASRRRGPGRELVMTAAGPAAGLALGGLALILYSLIGPRVGPTAYWTLRRLYEVNLFWSLFNLLPMLPLDGGLMLVQSLELAGVARAGAIGRRVSVAVALAAGAAAFYAGESIIGLFAIYILSRNWKTRPGDSAPPGAPT